MLEVLIAIALGVIMLAAVVLLNMTGFRSFASMANYVDLDAKGRNALDWMSRDLRGATNLANVTTNASGVTFNFGTVDDSGNPTNVTYTFNSDAHTLSRNDDLVLLKGWVSWNYSMYQRTPQPDYGLTSTTTFDNCKVVVIRWNCSRTILGQSLNSQNAQTAQIVLRNK